MIIYIIGGGTCSYQMASQLRKKGFVEDIVIITREDWLPYNRVLLPKLLRQEIDITKCFFKDLNWYRENNIAVYGLLEVEKKLNGMIEVSEPSSQSNDSESELLYKPSYKYVRTQLVEGLNDPHNKIVWATGGKAFTPPMYVHLEQSRVFTWRTIEDTLNLAKTLQTKQNTAIIGGSYIAMELAMACRHYNTPTTWLIKTPTFLRDGIDSRIQNQILYNWNDLNPHFSPLFNQNINDVQNKTERIELSLTDQSILASQIVLGTGIYPSTKIIQTGNSLSLNEREYVVGDLLEIVHPITSQIVKCGSFNQAVKTSTLLADLIIDPTLKIDLSKVVDIPYQIQFSNKIIRSSGSISAFGADSVVEENDTKITQKWVYENTDLGYITIAK